MKRLYPFLILCFYFLLVFSLPGCSEARRPVPKKQEASYPQTPEKVAANFVKEIIKGNFKDANKYTHKLDFNGAGYKIMKKEVASDRIIDQNKGSKLNLLITLDTKGSSGERELNLEKIDGEWKVTGTYVTDNDYFKDFATFLWYIDRKNTNLLYKLYGHNKKGLTNRDIDRLLELFKDKDPVITYPVYGSIEQRSIDHKIYKEGTTTGIVFNFTKDPKSKFSRTWTLGKEFND